MFELSALLIVVCLGLIVFIFYKDSKNKLKKEINSTVLLEQIKQVCKLITVEGDFTEILNHTDTTSHFFDVLKSQKKALVIVNAKALVGFDVNLLNVKIDPKKRSIHIKEMPDPEIVSLETDIKFYDIKNGTFNRFKPEDLSELSVKSKELIRSKIKQTNLSSFASRQAQEMMSLLIKFTEHSNWVISIGEPNPEVKQIQITKTRDL